VPAVRLEAAVKIVTHESVQPGVLYAVGPCTCKGEDPKCPRCNGVGIFAVKAKGVKL
jgi:hypothetical protein